MYRTRIPAIAAAKAAAEGVDAAAKKASPAAAAAAASGAAVQRRAPESNHRPFYGIPPPIGTPIVAREAPVSRKAHAPSSSSAAARGVPLPPSPRNATSSGVSPTGASRSPLSAPHAKPPSAASPLHSQQQQQKSQPQSPTARAATAYAEELRASATAASDATARNLALRAVEPIPYRAEDDGRLCATSSVISGEGASNSGGGYAAIVPLTADLVSSLLSCPKRFVLDRYLSRADAPPMSEGDRMLAEDGTQFAQLCRQKYSMGSAPQHGSGERIFRIVSPSYENALEETAAAMRFYFTEWLPRQPDPRRCGPATFLMPAFNALVDPAALTGLGLDRAGTTSSSISNLPNNGAAPSGSSSASSQPSSSSPSSAASQRVPAVAFELRSRISVLQYYPSTGRWLSHASQASTSLAAADMERLYVKQLVQLYTLRHCADRESVAAYGSGGSGGTNSNGAFHNRAFSSSFFDLRETAPAFVASLTDEAISVGGTASSPTRSKVAGGGQTAVTASVDLLFPRMVPITEDCFSRRTMAAMVCSTPASALRGAFLNGTPSVASLQHALGGRDSVGGVASSSSMSGDEEAALSMALGGGRKPGLPAAVREAAGRAASALLPLLQAQHADGASIGLAVGVGSSTAARQIRHAELVADTMADPSRLEFPFVLPLGAELLPDMAIGDALVSHSYRVMRQSGLFGGVAASSSAEESDTTSLLFATAEPRKSLLEARSRLARTFGGAVGEEARGEAVVDPSACFRESCSDCSYFTAGYCRGGASAVAAEAEGGKGGDVDGSHEGDSAGLGADFIFTLPGVRSAAKRVLHRAGVRSAEDIASRLGLPRFEPAPVGSSGAKKSSFSGSGAALGGEGDVRAVIANFNAKQKMYTYCAANGLVAVNPGATRKWLAAVRYPIIGIDFEAAAFALPRFAKLKPYGQLPFQFSSISYTEDPFAAEWASRPPAYAAQADRLRAGGVGAGKKAGGKKKGAVAATKTNTVVTTAGVAPTVSSEVVAGLFSSVLPPMPAPVHTQSFCALGEAFNARDDPRRRVGAALHVMIDQSRAAQQRANAAAKQSLIQGTALVPALTTHSFAADIDDDNNNGSGGDASADAKGRRRRSPRVRGSADRYHAKDLLVDGLHSTISKAAGLRIVMPDPAAHGTLLGHSVQFERSAFASVASLVREETVGYAGRAKTAELFDSLVFMDSLRLASDALIHPLTRGSSSLKRLVPALVPTSGPQYADLDIADGQSASAVYRDWVTAMTQKLPLQSVHDAANPPSRDAEASKQEVEGEEAVAPTEAEAAESPSANAYAAHALRVTALNAAFEKKRKELIAYCDADTAQMIAVVREVSRIAALAEAVAALGGPAGGVAVPILGASASTQYVFGDASSYSGSAPAADAVAEFVSPSGERLSARWADFGNGWVGIPIATVVATREG